MLNVWEGAKDLTTGTVAVHWLLRVVKGVNRTTWQNGNAGSQPWSVTIGGITVDSGSNFGFNFDTVSHLYAPGTVFTISEGSRVFAYGANGALNLGVSAYADANIYDGPTFIMGAASISGQTFAPAPINVATQPEVDPKSSVVSGTVAIALPRMKPTYTHDVTWASGALSGTIATGVATATTWTVPDVTGQFPHQAQSPITITAVTKNAGVAIGTKSTVLMVWNENPVVDAVQRLPFDVRARLVEWDTPTGRLQVGFPVSAMSINLVDAQSATATCTIKSSERDPAFLALDGKLVLIEVQNGDEWQSTGLLFTMARTQDDDTDLAGVQQYSGTAFVDHSLKVGYRTTDWNASQTAGSVMKALVDQGHGRSWGPNIRTSFTAALATPGNPWPAAEERNLTGGTPYSQVLEALVNDGWCEYRTRYSDADGKAYLDLLAPNTGTDWTNPASLVIVNLATAKLSSAPSARSTEGLLDRVYGIGEAPEGSGDTHYNAPLVTAERPLADTNVYGAREGWVAASGETTAAGALTVAQNALANAVGTDSRSFSYSAHAVARVQLPYYTFKPGDWILVADRERVGDPVRERVSQVVIDKSGEDITVTVTVGDVIQSGAAANAKRINASTGGAISGGSLLQPIRIQTLIPAAPNYAGENAATAVGYWNSAGEPRAKIDFAWLPVTRTIDDTPIDVNYYEVWWRPNPSTAPALRTFSATSDVEMTDWPINFNLQLRTRARSAAGTLGPFSAWQDVTTPEPAAELDGLTIGDLYTDGVGTIYVAWNGLVDGMTAPLRLDYVAAEYRPVIEPPGTPATYQPVGQTIAQAGTISFAPTNTSGGVAYGVYDVRLRAYDKLGNPGEASDSQQVTILDPHISPAIPEAPTGLTVTPGSGWNEAGTLPVAWFDLEWDPVALDLDGNAITVVGYDIWGTRGGETSSQFVTTSTGTSARVYVDPGSTWTYQVNATSNFGGVSALGDAVTAEATASLAGPGVPDAPTLSQYAGILRIRWAGGGMTPSVRYAYATISTSPSGPFTRAGMPLNGAGEVVVPGLAQNETYYAQIVLVDEVGQTATSSASAGLLLQPITGETIQTSPLANTGIKMTDASFTAYDASGNPTFIIDAVTGEVWIAPYEAVFHLGAPGTVAETGTPTTGLSISSDDSSFNTFIHSAGMQIRNDLNPLSWWEADAADANLVNFFSPRANILERFRIGDYELVREAKPGGGSRIVSRYKSG